MSVTVMGAVWWSTIEGSSKRFVLLALADRADDDGYCYPGVENLMQKTDLSEATVKRMLRELRADGLLATSYRWAADGSQDTNETQINLPMLETMRRPRKEERGRGRRPTETTATQPETRAERREREGVTMTPPMDAAEEPQVAEGDHHDPPVTMTPPGGSPRPQGGVTMTPNTSDPSEEIPLTPMPSPAAVGVSPPPRPPAAAGGALSEEAGEAPARCSAHGRRSCRPCGLSPRAQAQARASAAAAVARASEQASQLDEREGRARRRSVPLGPVAEAARAELRSGAWRSRAG